MEEMNANFNFEIISSSAVAQKLCKGSSGKFPIKKVGNNEIEEMYSEASVQNFQTSGFEDYTSAPTDNKIKSIVSNLKKKIRARVSLKSLQKLNESMTPLFGILNDLEARLTEQIDERLDEMKRRLEEQLLQEIKLAMECQADMQRQQFKDLRSEILEIKSAMQIMTRAKYKARACLSSAKECTNYSIEELKSEKINSSKPQSDNKSEMNSTQESDDSVRDEKYLKDVPLSHENLLPDQYVHILREILSVHAHGTNAHDVLDIENKIRSVQQGCETEKPQKCKMTENAEKAMSHTDCNGDAGMLDEHPQEEKLGNNACCPEVLKENLFLEDENFPHLSMYEQNSEKCENLPNRIIKNDMEVSSKINNSNINISESGRKRNNDNQYKKGIQYSRMGTGVSSSARHCNRYNVTEVKQTFEDMNQLDKLISGDEIGRVKELKDILSHKLSESLANKDKDLNLNTHKKQTPKMAVHTNVLQEKQPCVKKRRSTLDEEKLSADRNHYPSGKRVKFAAFSRRLPHRFSESEVECLISSVEKFGTGRWQDIKEMYFSTFLFRTAADLKDKWRSLLHSAMRIADNGNFRTSVPVSILKRVHSIHRKRHYKP